MKLDAVNTFVDVMKLGSFAAVARHHDVDPSSVSRTIAGLEQELGFRLFLRTTRKLAPTEAGRIYFSRVERLLGEFEEAGQQALDLLNQPEGSVRLTACTSFGERVLAPLLPKLTQLYPKLSLDLLLTDRQVDLVAEQVDIAIRFGAQPAGNFVAVRLAPRRFRVCGSPGFAETIGHRLKPEDLKDLDCLLFPIPGYRDRWIFRRDGEAPFSVPVNGRLTISHGLTMTACTVAGLGPALLPDWLCRKELKEGTLVDLLPDYECAAAEFDSAAWLIYPSRDYVPLKLRVLVDFLKSEVHGWA